MGEERKEVTIEEFENAEAELRGAILSASSKATLPSFLVKDKPKENAFDYVVKQLKDVHEDAGAICKQYIKYAAELEKLDDAEAEIRRLLDIERYDLDISHDTAKEAAKEIVAMYMPALRYDDTSVDQNVGAVLTEIQHMKSLLDIMEKNIQGKLTEQEVAEMGKNGESWIIDIEKLRQMVAALEN